MYNKVSICTPISLFLSLLLPSGACVSACVWTTYMSGLQPDMSNVFFSSVFVVVLFSGCKLNICFCAIAIQRFSRMCESMFIIIVGIAKLAVCMSLHLPLFWGMRLRRQNVRFHVYTWHVCVFVYACFQRQHPINSIWCDAIKTEPMNMYTHKLWIYGEIQMDKPFVQGDFNSLAKLI